MQTADTGLNQVFKIRVLSKCLKHLRRFLYATSVVSRQSYWNVLNVESKSNICHSGVDRLGFLFHTEHTLATETVLSPYLRHEYTKYLLRRL